MWAAEFQAFRRRTYRMRLSLAVPLVTAGSIALMLSGLETAAPQGKSPRAVFDQYCVTCHNEKLHTAGLALDKLDAANPGRNPEEWERVIGKLPSGSITPPGRPRPDVATYRIAATWLENEIDRAWTASPKPGRIGAVHRLNRTEYNNAIRDLLAINLDVKSQLPGDETADGSFDNFADSLTISTAHLERYLSVARQDRKSTRLNSSHGYISYAVFCLKKK